MGDQSEGLDIIGDIHGHANELRKLLRELDYSLIDGVYRHSNRRVLFLGDFIDKGPHQREVLKIVIPMVEQGAALAIMGNHEFNALAFHTENPQQPGTWLRPRKDSNIKQHLAFLSEFLGHNDPEDPYGLADVLAFFKTLPLWLEINGMRAVHACWNDVEIQNLRKCLNADNTLTDEFLVLANQKGTPEYKGVETLLKGVEYTLPEGLKIRDNYSKARSAVRVKWWCNEGGRVSELGLSIGANGLSEEVASYVIPKEALIGYPEHEKPLFLGHYWMEGAPSRLGPNIACLDYSVANHGKLVAYRWDGEQTLDDSKFVTEKY